MPSIKVYSTIPYSGPDFDDAFHALSNVAMRTNWVISISYNKPDYTVFTTFSKEVNGQLLIMEFEKEFRNLQIIETSLLPK